MAARPYRQTGVVELERLFRDNSGNLAVVQALADELKHRKTQRARMLADQVRPRLEELTAELDAADNTPVRLVPAAATPREESDDESELYAIGLRSAALSLPELVVGESDPGARRPGFKDLLPARRLPEDLGVEPATALVAQND